MTNNDIHNYICIKGARQNNLKNIDVNIPKNKLVVITGLSGSGKSSLAFNTIYAEGRRRYLESLSSYARQFLGNNEKPDVDSIEGLLPAISIDQKTTSNNPRSTVGTVTEIYDYLRLLWSRIGISYCPNGHGMIKILTTKQIVEKIYQDFKIGSHIQILSPIAYKQKGTFVNELNKLKFDGFLRVRIDGVIYSLDDKIELEKNKSHSIYIIVDRIILNKDNQTYDRLNDAIETCLKYGDNKVLIWIENIKEILYSKNHSCPVCGFNIPEMEPRLFSFNSPLGYCEKCKGIGSTYEPSEERMIPNKSLSINEDAIRWFKNTMNTKNLEWQKFSALLDYYKIDRNKPINNLSRHEIDLMMWGSDEPIEVVAKSENGKTYVFNDYIEGVLKTIKRRHQETNSEMSREFYNFYMVEKPCDLCNGQRLNKKALSVKINNKNIIDVCNMSVSEMLNWFINLKLNETEKTIAKQVLKEIIDRLTFLVNVGLDYLTLSRSAGTLSGGENQRIRLAAQIGSSLTGVLYVLDEPSIGLHQKDNQKLINTMKSMRDLGNSIIVVEHDIETMLSADYIVDIGPGAGVNGGKVVGKGNINNIIKSKESITGKYLSGEYVIPTPKKRRGGNGKKIILFGCNANNLKNIDVSLPLGKLICVTGVSGSGKSTLINETLVGNIRKILFNPFEIAPKIKRITGVNNIENIVVVTQDPIGRTPRSNPATYVGLFDDIREIFAKTTEAKAKGYSKSRFSFNCAEGRCEKCQGDGYIRIAMHFLPDVYVKCDECNGKKYNQETLSILYKNKSIYDVLEMSVDDAFKFFENIPSIRHKLELMIDVGLGYLKLGELSTNLSGGEAQRIKLAKFLQRKANDKTMVVLDEPSTGLHQHDVSKLINVLNKIVDRGSTVIIIEHNLDIIKCADYIIDLGPDGGDKGGNIIATGTPEQILKNKNKSYTAEFLDKILNTN